MSFKSIEAPHEIKERLLESSASDGGLHSQKIGQPWQTEELTTQILQLKVRSQTMHLPHNDVLASRRRSCRVICNSNESCFDDLVGKAVKSIKKCLREVFNI